MEIPAKRCCLIYLLNHKDFTRPLESLDTCTYIYLRIMPQETFAKLRCINVFTITRHPAFILYDFHSDRKRRFEASSRSRYINFTIFFIPMNDAFVFVKNPRGLSQEDAKKKCRSAPESP